MSGMRDGKGKEEKHGSEYYGDWRLDQRCGFGKQTHEDGRCYIGSWKNDRHDGLGTFKQNGYMYEGHWKGGMKHGKGRETWSSETGSEFKEFDGEFAYGGKDGHGTMWYRDGSTFGGLWQSDKPCQGKTNRKKGTYALRNILSKKRN